MKKSCPVCKIQFSGRMDKKYCSANCKSIDHYEKRRKEEKFYFEVDRQLKINRRILKKYNRNGMTKLKCEILVSEGFNPNFFTHYWKNRKGDVYLFCYDYGFLKLKDKINGSVKEKYIIVEWQEYMKKGKFVN